MTITKKQVGLVILFSIITCGIYSLYWIYSTQEQLRTIQDEYQTTGGMVVLLSIVTCNIYGIYWWYKVGTLMAKADPSIEAKGVLYVVLSLFGFSIVNTAFVQSDLNRIADATGQDDNFDF